MHVQALLAVNCCSEAVSIRLSLIKRPHAGQGLFLSRSIGKRVVVWYYFGKLVYAAGGEGVETTKAMGERCMEVSPEVFTK